MNAEPRPALANAVRRTDEGLSRVKGRRRRSRWIAAVALGLISSTFSTIVSQLFAARIGRDAAVDWMTVAAIPARDWAISAEPSWSAILTGIAFHQWADFSWALVFFGVLGRWTADLRPATILLLALPWAAFSSATEWFVLVPLFPFWQPLFTLQQPYWIGLLVHGTSALMYPLFARLRWRRGAAAERDIRFTNAWITGALVVVALLGAIALFGSHGYEPPWMGRDRDADQTYIRHMTAHHAQGIELARIAVERAQGPHLRKLAMLMVASQAGEIRIFENWWLSWFDTEMPDCSTEERAAMPGFLAQAEMRQVKAAPADRFDAVFVESMSKHHMGAARMADRMWRSGGDPRLRVMAHAIRHAQQGEIALMHDASGISAVATAVRNMLADNVN
ncbi:MULTISPECIES: DUF305 domain-containing protein [Bradyrhizobium]|uniref:DUF305 domain-containing protein n=1 Tax=Bradyrhizobium ottawaense TaxID=931866 RepID=A0A2U8PDY8_9BRAD|nr:MULTISPECIES: DUF305 domain-containing protein [Bradyrhizobium]AWL95587.1 DUF305 domain-containing protein [Bradyrhizobium ottawaense]MBR1294347.1 DUF305 domain-containing protein [Bradyrhizobium ottawaense]MBR1325251.1 DUF305 domain-containing protein [Bradyrhizobium ottawaense]MBR1336439.1 DUF305 domain-containing protein [Bradyrhizobium ottawaense]WLB43216.1 DUF305 domain-containing protein [Bradyrhizobium ottawaense]